MRYEVASITTLTAAGAPFATIKAGAGSRMKIREIGISLVTGVASDIALARSATATTTPTIILGQAIDPADPAGIGGIAVAWTTIGTANLISIRRMQFPATVAAGVIWTWSDDNPLTVPSPAATGELMFVNRGAGVCATFDIYVSWTE
ncbi:MAG: hypothetical protein M3R61_00160 [Chloroflexota bacterium]|nr:hypothetical protein [Chloroflexota bacterium]